jgi:hypothetical protein
MASTENLSFSLKATYSSPTNAPFIHEQPLQAPPTSSTKDKTTYLSALRKATVDLQERINKELTARMEEDKARDASGRGKESIDDKKEEENYGEEVVEED